MGLTDYASEILTNDRAAKAQLEAEQERAQRRASARAGIREDSRVRGRFGSLRGCAVSSHTPGTRMMHMLRLSESEAGAGDRRSER